MERIPCELSIKIDYTNLSVGEVLLTSQLFTEIEGSLFISLENKVIFSESGILLLELAKQLNDWLKDPQYDFEYYSMDYEDGPILFFKRDGIECWKIGSVWMEEIYSSIDIFEIINASKKFIDKLCRQLHSEEIKFEHLLLK
ncbi:hypothetical protein GCM10023211_09000 [Orbus sasakiae]|uniref:DUF7878 domain-containing protein n=1 Tax=Orbus sasakiae TaxID=1078475 RepID=A0ABP9N8M9_9GAMM